jgi:hypothetical protein
MTQPRHIDEQSVAALRSAFSADQLVELTLKVMKFNTQKVMVALGVDFAVDPAKVADLAWNTDGAFVAATEREP